MSSGAPLAEVLEEAHRLGFLGDDQVARHIEHAQGFADVLAQVLSEHPESGVSPVRLLDLGSGGGLPGLAMLQVPGFADLVKEVALLDGSSRRAEWLRHAVARLEPDVPVRVIEMRAEVAGHDPEMRGSFAIVVARSFGRPGITAECAAPLLRVGGLLIVSEPPAGETPPGDRWPPAALSLVGLSPATDRRARGFAFVSMLATAPASDRYPRRNGVPAKRPLF